MTFKLGLLIVLLSAAGGNGEVRSEPDTPAEAEKKTESKKPVNQKSLKKPKAKSPTKPTTPALTDHKKSQKVKKDPARSVKKAPTSPATKSPKKSDELSAEDAEIIEQMEFLMLLDLLRDFELFEEDPI